MRIAFIAEQSKRELMASFCLAYKLILRKHELWATELTARKIEEVGLPVKKLLAGNMGGDMQLISQIERNEVDALIYFYTPDSHVDARSAFDFQHLLDVCDLNLVPIATNMAMAEVLVMGLEHGDLDWREGYGGKQG